MDDEPAAAVAAPETAKAPAAQEPDIGDIELGGLDDLNLSLDDEPAPGLKSAADKAVSADLGTDDLSQLLDTGSLDGLDLSLDDLSLDDTPGGPKT